MPDWGFGRVGSWVDPRPWKRRPWGGSMESSAGWPAFTLRAWSVGDGGRPLSSRRIDVGTQVEVWAAPTADAVNEVSVGLNNARWGAAVDGVPYAIWADEDDAVRFRRVVPLEERAGGSGDGRGASAAPALAGDPEEYTAHTHILAAAWVDGDGYVRAMYSFDHGVTWFEAVVSTTAMEDCANPSVVVTDAEVFVVWTALRYGSGPHVYLAGARPGESWVFRPPAQVDITVAAIRKPEAPSLTNPPFGAANEAPGSDVCSFASIAASCASDRNGRGPVVGIVWKSEVDGATTVRVRAFTAATYWAAADLAEDAPSADLGVVRDVAGATDARDPCIAAGPAGTFCAAWVQPAPSRDADHVYAAFSEDPAGTSGGWGDPVDSRRAGPPTRTTPRWRWTRPPASRWRCGSSVARTRRPSAGPGATWSLPMPGRASSSRPAWKPPPAPSAMPTRLS